MIDGIKIYYHLTDFEAWKGAINIELFTPTDLETGATKGKLRAVNGSLHQTLTHRGSFGTYQITVKETTITNLRGKSSLSFFLILDGSLHKNHFGGANYLPFAWEHLQQEITNIENGLLLLGHLAELSNIEIGVNLTVPFPVFPFLTQNLIAYKGNQFNKYKPDKNGICLGYVCHLRQYSVKIYDKGKQHNLPENIMRFELRYLKMQALKEKGIKTLSDLKSQEIVNELLQLLLAAWENVLLYDSSINLSDPEIKPKDRHLLNDGRRAGYWDELKEKDTRNFNYQRSKFRTLVNKYGQRWNEKIKELINTEWQSLFKNCTILPSVQKPELDKFTVKVNGYNGQNGHYKKEGRFFHGQKPEFPERIKEEFSYPIKKEFSYTDKKRVCQSCGRDIGNQNSRSKFCSSKFVGESAAHRCRNKNSNPRNNLKRKIRILAQKGLLFDITPFLAPVDT